MLLPPLQAKKWKPLSSTEQQVFVIFRPIAPATKAESVLPDAGLCALTDLKN
jgi:hypothetical protein